MSELEIYKGMVKKMKDDEIKEILDNFKIYEDRYKKCNETQFIIFYRDIHLLLDYITNLQQRIEKAVEYIEKDTRWFDSEYAKVYEELCSCAGANDNRLEVLVNPSNLLNILNGRSDK